MNLKSTYWFFEKLLDDNLCLLYSGYFSEEILRKLMDLSEMKLEDIEEFKKKRKKMLFLMAEGFQNIIKHGEKKHLNGNSIDNKNFFLTLTRGNVIFISTGNLIENENVADLQKQLMEVNSLDDAGLKELHSYVMKHGSLSDRGGAGLGLIAIARKSDQKLNYSFEKYNQDLSLYYNQIVLKSMEEITEKDTNSLLPISESIEYHKRMMDENILMIQKGDFSENSLEHILNVVENNLKEELSESKNVKGLYDVIHQLIENTSNHGMEINGKKEGIFLLSKINSNYTINTGHYISHDKINPLKERINLLIDQKKQGTLDDNKENGIGYIEIAKACNEPLRYTCEKIDEEKSFFSLSVTL